MDPVTTNWIEDAQDACDTHAAETVAWLAAELLTDLLAGA